MKESLLKLFLRKMRINKVLPIIKKYPNSKLLDIGCGFNYKLLLEVEQYISEGYGIDYKVPELKNGKIKTKQIKINDKLPFRNNSFDFVTMLTVLEYFEHPVEIIREIERVLKPKGKLILTVPTRNAKPILEFLAYKLKIFNEEEVNDNNKYYNYSDLEKLFKETDRLKIQEHRYFEFYMNNFCIAGKELHKWRRKRKMIQLEIVNSINEYKVTVIKHTVRNNFIKILYLTNKIKVGVKYIWKFLLTNLTQPVKN